MIQTILLWIKTKLEVLVSSINKKYGTPEMKANEALRLKYLRLCAIYEGDMKITDNDYVNVFLIQLQDYDGREYLSPIYVAPNLRDTVRHSLQICKPVHCLFTEHQDGGVSLKPDVVVNKTGDTSKVTSVSDYKDKVKV